MFYFGNMIGETGDRPGSAAVTVLDIIKVRRRMGGRGAGLSEPSDFNRDGRVNALDTIIARGNQLRGTLRLLNAPASDAGAASIGSTGTFGDAPIQLAPANASTSKTSGVWEETQPDLLGRQA